MIGQTLPQLFASYASLGRIQGFLQLPEKAESVSEHDLLEADLIDGLDDVVKVSTVQVSLQRCTFGWDEKTQVLHDVTIDLAPGELHLVVGSVASVSVLRI